MSGKVPLLFWHFVGAMTVRRLPAGVGIFQTFGCLGR